jgi:uncharacterized protein (TIGR02594 family)
VSFANERRTVLKFAAAGAGYIFSNGLGWAATTQALDGRDFFSPDLPDLRVLGTRPALGEEIAKARQILSELPSTAPFEIMTRLAALTDANAQGELYRGGWQTRWNPLIVTMFQETTQKPSGDLTPWCAASLNWALRRAGLKGTNSASSGSFRGFPANSVTTTPKQGDIVVFRSADPAKATLGRGHVGLFVDKTQTHVRVLGGNQISSAGHHEFSSKVIPLNGPALALHSFHSVEAFQHV